jgi:hypothetical protein
VAGPRTVDDAVDAEAPPSADLLHAAIDALEKHSEMLPPQHGEHPA